jgi:hypothetical protein
MSKEGSGGSGIVHLKFWFLFLTSDFRFTAHDYRLILTENRFRYL